MHISTHFASTGHISYYQYRLNIKVFALFFLHSHGHCLKIKTRLEMNKQIISSDAQNVSVCLFGCMWIQDTSLEYWDHIKNWKNKLNLCWVCLFAPSMCVPAGQCIFMHLVPSGVQCRPVQTSTHSGWRKNLWTLNDSVPFHSILIRLCYLWSEGGGARHSMKASSFHIYPCCLATAGPSFVKSAVADREVGGRKWTYRMHTGMTTIPIYRENRD